MGQFIEIQNVLFNKEDIQLVKKTLGSRSEPSIAVVMKNQECYVLPFALEETRDKKFSNVKDDLLGVSSEHPLEKVFRDMIIERMQTTDMVPTSWQQLNG